MTITRTTSVQNGRATAQATIPQTQPGTYPIDATYQETNTHKSGEGTGQLIIQRYPTTTTLATTTNNTYVNWNTTITITTSTSSGTCTGTVKLYDNETLLDTLTLKKNGTVSTTLTSSTTHTYQLKAIYQGDEYHNTSTSNTENITFQKHAATLTTNTNNITGVELGDTIHITGSLQSESNNTQYPVQGATIKLKTGNTTVATTTTSYQGIYDLSYTTTIQNATYTVEYEGNTTTSSATSSNITITCYRAHTITPTLNRGCIQPNGIVVLTFQDRNNNLLTNYSGTATIGQNTQIFTTNNNGQATIQFTELQTVGDYTLQINNTQEYYSTSIPLIVRHDVIISVPDVTVNQGETAVITATLNDENQTPVTSGQVEWTITEIQED